MEYVIDEIFRYVTSVSSFIRHLILSHAKISIFCALLKNFHFSYVAFVAIKQKYYQLLITLFFYQYQCNVNQRRLSESLRKVSIDSVARDRATDPQQF